MFGVALLVNKSLHYLIKIPIVLRYLFCIICHHWDFVKSKSRSAWLFACYFSAKISTAAFSIIACVLIYNISVITISPKTWVIIESVVIFVAIWGYASIFSHESCNKTTAVISTLPTTPLITENRLLRPTCLMIMAFAFFCKKSLTVTYDGRLNQRLQLAWRRLHYVNHVC